jgi:hypothetical protein
MSVTIPAAQEVAPAIAMADLGRSAKAMISRDLIEDMFANTRGKASWDIDGLCLWGYFFCDKSRSKLMNAAPALEKMGYRFVGVMEPTPQDDDQATLTLHVEKEEVHTVDSLLARNAVLYRFADEFDLEDYDGMDVGPVQKK